MPSTNNSNPSSPIGLLDALRATKPFAPAARRLEVDGDRIRANHCGVTGCQSCTTEWITIPPTRPYSDEARALAWRLERPLQTHWHSIVDALAAADSKEKAA